MLQTAKELYTLLDQIKDDREWSIYWRPLHQNLERILRSNKEENIKVEEISYIYRMYMSYPFAPQVPVEALGQFLIDQIYRRNRK